MSLRSFGTAVPGRALAGFFLLGFSLALGGTLVPAWGYDLSTNFAIVGRFFAAFIAGIGLFVFVLPRARKALSARTLLVGGCTLCAGALAAFLPLAPETLWRSVRLSVIGISAGALLAGVFEVIQHPPGGVPARVWSLAGVSFGAGSVFCALLVSWLFWSLSSQYLLLALAAVPASFAIFFLLRPNEKITAPPKPEIGHPLGAAAVVLCSTLVFFQWGNEWSVAGWLPLLLIHRIGMSPAHALELLAFYFATLTAGRIAMTALLRGIWQTRLLQIAIATSLFGCLLLAFADNRLGVTLALGFLGFGWAAIYPFVTVLIGRRFPQTDVFLWKRILLIGVAGGMLSPWLLGEAAQIFGIRVIMFLPTLGTCIVMMLLGLIWVETKVTGE